MTATPSLTPIRSTAKLTWNWRGHQIKYTIAGAGQPLLLIHGFGASIDHWRKNIPVLAEGGYQVYAIDLLGFGDSDKAVSEQPEIVQTCLRLFQSDAIGGDLLTSYHTAYGLLNSVTEYFNHHSTVKSNENRFSSLLTGSMGKVQNKFQSQLVKAFC